jgi:hypothetical protein
MEGGKEMRCKACNHGLDRYEEVYCDKCKEDMNDVWDELRKGEDDIDPEELQRYGGKHGNSKV